MLPSLHDLSVRISLYLLIRSIKLCAEEWLMHVTYRCCVLNAVELQYIRWGNMSENWIAISLKFAIQSHKMVQHYCKIAIFQPHYRSIPRIYYFLIALRAHYCHRIIWNWPLYGSCNCCDEDLSPVTLHVLRKDKNNFSSLPTVEISLLCTFTMQKWSSAVWSGRPKTEILNNPCVLCIRMVVFLKSSGTWIATTQHQTPLENGYITMSTMGILRAQ